MWNEVIPNHAAQQELKRKVIISTAAQAFARQGCYAVTLDDVALRLGVSKAALYRYILNKHDLILACQEEALDIAERTLAQAIAKEMSGLAKIQEALRLYLLDSMQELGVPALILEDNVIQGDAAESVRARRRTYELGLRDLVTEGMSDGSVYPVEPKMAVFMLLGAVHWVAKWYRRDGSMSPDEVAATLVGLATRALVPTVGTTQDAMICFSSNKD